MRVRIIEAECLGVMEADVRTGVSRRTGRRWAYDGKARSVQLGSWLLIPCAEIPRGPHPGNFPFGSEKLRPEASEDEQLRVIVTNAGKKLALKPDICIQILRQRRLLPKTPCSVVRLDDIPNGLDAAETEKYLREHGAELCRGTVK